MAGPHRGSRREILFESATECGSNPIAMAQPIVGHRSYHWHSQCRARFAELSPCQAAAFRWQEIGTER